QVGQVFLYFQWDSLLLEAGFLAVLVAPLRLLSWGALAWRPHDSVTFWLVRWLLFRLMFASGVVKLTSRCPTWWGLTALTYHYETQCIPTPAAWFAHQLPVSFQKFSVVATYIIEIAVPVLFFAPIRRLRLFAFYSQVLLQVLIILTGNYNFFNMLTIVLASSLLDEEHVGRWTGRSRRRNTGSWPPSLGSFLSTLLELSTYSLLLYWSIQYFGLEINWEKRLLESKVAFTYHEFRMWLRAVTLPLVGLAFLSLSWEILAAMYQCVMGGDTPGCCGVAEGGIAAGRDTGRVWWSRVGRLDPGAVWSRGLVMGAGSIRGGLSPSTTTGWGRLDRAAWGEGPGEIEFMYKPGNMSRAPPVVAPHQPRLDWQMWFAALGHHSSSPWFSSFVHRLLQGQEDVIRLVQVDESQYPFSARPPVYIRAQLYKYWFTSSAEGSDSWWRRQRVQEFFPTVSLGDPTLENLLNQHGLKDKTLARRPLTTVLPRVLQSLRRLCRPLPGPTILWSLYLVVATACLLRALRRQRRGGTPPTRHKGPRRGEPADRGGAEKNGHVRRREPQEKGESRACGGTEGCGDGRGDGRHGTKRKK
ncbi:LMF2 factor, partial [Probosciger aterrimus]|nr:LMF2 factor [Probosciger aterrimus]